MATLVSVVKDGGLLVFTYDDGKVLKKSIAYRDAMVSNPPPGYEEIGNCYVNTSTGVVIVNYNGASVELGTPLTGAEVVAALEALGAGSRLSHTKLDDVGADDHHAKYTDVEAVAAAKTVKLDDLTAPDDNTDLDSSDSLHGLMSKADKSKLDGYATEVETEELKLPEGSAPLVEAGHVSVYADTDSHLNAASSGGTVDLYDHGDRHENAGSDEISVAGLSGLLADVQNSIKEIVIPLAFDLSGAATNEVAFMGYQAATLLGYRVLYTEASSADAGVSLRVGRLEADGTFDDDYYDAITSEVSKVVGYSKLYESGDLSHSAIAVGETVTVGCAGGKTGTGEVKLILFIQYS